MSDFTISLSELVYSVTCQTCGKRFYVKIEPENDIPSTAEILWEIECWDCSDHPDEDQLAELQVTL